MLKGFTLDLEPYPKVVKCKTPINVSRKCFRDTEAQIERGFPETNVSNQSYLGSPD